MRKKSIQTRETNSKIKAKNKIHNVNKEGEEEKEKSDNQKGFKVCSRQITKIIQEQRIKV